MADRARTKVKGRPRPKASYRATRRNVLAKRQRLAAMVRRAVRDGEITVDEMHALLATRITVDEMHALLATRMPTSGDDIGDMKGGADG